MQPFKSNSHIHLPPNFSAFEAVGQMIEMAAGEGVSVVGVSNYYDYTVYGPFAALARQQGIFPLFGIEVISMVEGLRASGVKVNDPGNPGKFYLCGKGITKFVDPRREPSPQPSPGVPGEGVRGEMTAEGERILETIRRNDSTRMRAVVKLLGEIFQRNGIETGLDEAAVIDRVVRRHGCPRETVFLQERHVCQAFQQRFFDLVPSAQRAAKLKEMFGVPPKAGADDAVQIQNEIRSHLLKAGKPAYVAETFITFEEAYRLVEEMGGIPCYPTLADGANPICGFEEPVGGLIERMKERNIGFAEFIPVRNRPEILGQYVRAMRKAGIVVTAGTEHNTLELLPIVPTCLGGVAIPGDVSAIFQEGVCVAVAHQYLTSQGETGFVGGCGEDRIGALRRVGERIIHESR